MRLLFCPKCSDVVKLEYKRRYCRCRKSFGKYTSKGGAIRLSKHAVNLAIGNGSVPFAIEMMEVLQKSKLSDKYDYISKAQVLAWIEPNPTYPQVGSSHK